MTTNGTHPPPPATDAAHGDVFLELNDEGKAALADFAWVGEQYHRGAWAAHAGEYIAVVRRQVVGVGGDPAGLRERAARECGVPPGRVVVSYIDSPNDL
jgi:hypothetical protein